MGMNTSGVIMYFDSSLAGPILAAPNGMMNCPPPPASCFSPKGPTAVSKTTVSSKIGLPSALALA